MSDPQGQIENKQLSVELAMEVLSALDLPGLLLFWQSSQCAAAEVIRLRAQVAELQAECSMLANAFAAKIEPSKN